MEIQEEEQAWVEAVEWEALVRPRLTCLTDSRVGVGAHSEQVTGGGLVKPEARRPTYGLHQSVGSVDPCFRSSPFSLGPCSGLGPAIGTL